MCYTFSLPETTALEVLVWEIKIVKQPRTQTLSAAQKVTCQNFRFGRGPQLTTEAISGCIEPRLSELPPRARAAAPQPPPPAPAFDYSMVLPSMMVGLFDLQTALVHDDTMC